MNITIDLNFLSYLLEGPYYTIVQRVFIFIIVLLVFYFICRIIWKHWSKHIRSRYLATQKYVLLAIDVPRDNQQGPEAVERLFSHLAGIKVKPSLHEKYILGQTQLDVSLEIISLEGQIQFLIYAPIQYRDLIEAAVYATYPGVEISEFEDYTKASPVKFPDKEYDLWGTDLKLYNKNPYPIRTYPNFEHTLTKELKDPMIDLLEILGKLQRDEQVWIQFIIRPIGSELKKKGEEIVAGLMGSRAAPQELADKSLGALVKIGQGLSDFFSDVFGLSADISSEEKKEEKKPLSPGEKRVIESIQAKISKIAFDTKIRLIYLAKKQAFSRDRGIIGVLSAFNSVNTLDMNGLEPDKKKTVKQRDDKAVVRRRIEARKIAIAAAYKKRARFWQVEVRGFRRIIKKITKFLTISWLKKKISILNIEELATLYHFPVVVLKPPLIKKTGSKRGEPPFGLPVK